MEEVHCCLKNANAPCGDGRCSRRQLAVVLIGWGRSLGESLSRDSGNEKCHRSTSTGHNLLQDSSTFTLLHIESVGLSQTWTNVIAIIEENGLLCTRRDCAPRSQFSPFAPGFTWLAHKAKRWPFTKTIKPVEMDSNHQRFQERDFLLVTIPGTRQNCFICG